MRIIFQADENDERVVMIGAKGDDQDINAVGDMLRAALAGWGFAEKTINELIESR